MFHAERWFESLSSVASSPRRVVEKAIETVLPVVAELPP
jgi:hypothetical protein